MNNIDFFSYRITALKVFIAQQLAQLKQLGIIITLFMYTAIPGLVLLLYFALGKILTKDTELGTLLACSILVSQSELSSALSNGIRDSKHRLFQRSLVTASTRKANDVILSLITNLVLLLCLPLIASIKTAQLVEAGHFLFFTLLVVFCGVYSSLKPERNKMFIMSAMMSFWLFPNHLVSYLWCVLICLVAVFIWSGKMSRTKLTCAHIGFWFSFHWHHLGQLWWRSLLLLALVACAGIIYRNRPDLDFFIHCLISPFILYVAASQQLNQNDVITRYQLWFNSLGVKASLLYPQFTAPVAKLTVGLLAVQSVVISLQSFGFFVSAGIALIAFAKMKADYFALGWFVITGMAITLNYWAYEFLNKAF